MPRRKPQHDATARTDYARVMLDHALDNLAQASRTVMPIATLPPRVLADLAHAIDAAKRARANLEIFRRNLARARGVTK